MRRIEFDESSHRNSERVCKSGEVASVVAQKSGGQRGHLNAVAAREHHGTHSLHQAIALRLGQCSHERIGFCTRLRRVFCIDEMIVGRGKRGSSGGGGGGCLVRQYASDEVLQFIRGTRSRNEVLWELRQERHELRVRPSQLREGAAGLRDQRRAQQRHLHLRTSRRKAAQQQGQQIILMHQAGGAGGDRRGAHGAAR